MAGPNIERATLHRACYNQRMEALFELLFEVLGELFLQLFVHLLGDLGARTVDAYRVRGPSRPYLSAFSHAFFGAAAGGLTLLVFPHSFAHTATMRLVALFGSPLLAGLASAMLGTRRRDAGKTSVLFETFAYGVLFAFAFALVRFFATA
ncbi:MAG: hypothetical protein R3B48_26445 [Kofleriaceae bacterium]